MININSFIQGQKVTWVKRLISNKRQLQHLTKHIININNIVNIGSKYLEGTLIAIKIVFLEICYKIICQLFRT